LIVLSFLCHLW